MKIFALIFLAALIPAFVVAENAYVSDVFEVTMRSGPSTQNTILRMLPSGATVEVLETDEETGYSRVNTASGVEGYVLSRFLMDQPAARDQLAGMRQQVSNLRQRNQELEARLGQATASRDELRQERDGLLRSNQGKDTELTEIRRVSANALDLNSQNQELQTSVQTMNHRMQAQISEIQELKDRRNRDWFLAGAAVLIGGILLGLILPKLRIRRRSSWSDL
ncbi:MAG: TIGR04211 family SH3 domain-containing protein [Gammaproteobacteria bacterium]|nr:TIGR04211 family SH3 domain-containing protein [Gammaproteobacteria bacterium]